MRPERLARWLCCPVVSVAAHWCLFADRRHLLAALPQLWTTEPSSAGRRSDSEQTPEDLLADFMQELDARRTTYDRVAGFAIVVVLWGGLAAMVAPPVLYLAGPLASQACRAWRQVLLPLCGWLHRWGAFEAAAYALALSLSGQGCRYPPGAADAGALTALAGGLAFMPCWAYSTWLHAEAGTEQRSMLFAAGALGALLEALALAPLALVHKSSLTGFLAISALYGSLAAALHGLGSPRSAGGFDPGSGAHCCAAASVLLVFGAMLLRGFGCMPDWQPFIAGLAVFGHCGYLGAVLAVASKWRSKWDTYIMRQVFAVLSLLAAWLGGRFLAAPALTCASYLFTLLFVLEKELENKFDHVTLKVLAAYLVLQHLYSIREYLLSIVEPAHLYA